MGRGEGSIAACCRVGGHILSSKQQARSSMVCTELQQRMIAACGLVVWAFAVLPTKVTCADSSAGIVLTQMQEVIRVFRSCGNVQASPFRILTLLANWQKEQRRLVYVDVLAPVHLVLCGLLIFQRSLHSQLVARSHGRCPCTSGRVHAAPLAPNSWKFEGTHPWTPTPAHLLRQRTWPAPQFVLFRGTSVLHRAGGRAPLGSKLSGVPSQMRESTFAQQLDVAEAKLCLLPQAFFFHWVFVIPASDQLPSLTLFPLRDLLRTPVHGSRLLKEVPLEARREPQRLPFSADIYSAPSL